MRRFIQYKRDCIYIFLFYHKYPRYWKNYLQKRLNFFLANYRVINTSQYGFRAEASTSRAFANATHYITSNLDKGYFNMGIFSDHRKKFDTVDHNILLKKLEFRGIRGVSGDFLRSYLSNLSQ